MQREEKRRKTSIILIIAIILVVIILVLVLIYILSLIKEKEISLGENVVEVLLNENKTEAYLKVDANDSVEKIKFVFVDDNNTEYNFETSSIAKEFTISAKDIGLESFEDIDNVSAEFEYKPENPIPSEDEEEYEEEIPIPDEFVCTPKTCFELGKECGDWDDGCGNSIDCSACQLGKKCENGMCVSDICVNETTAATCANNACGMKKNNCNIDVNCSQVNLQACQVTCTPNCAGKTCGADDGCNGKCTSGSCSAGQTCVNGVCNPTGQAVCGNSKLETGETCDDGGKANSDGCNSNCQIETSWKCNKLFPTRCIYKAPYDVSDFITGISFDLSTRKKYGQEGDQWPMTWHSDDNVYAGYGDGYGFNREIDKQYMGVTRIKGSSPSSLIGDDLWGMPTTGSIDTKPGAFISYNNIIYLFHDIKGENPKRSYIAWSTNNGVSFTRPTTAVFDTSKDGADMILIGLLQNGKGYSGNTDGYFYAYFAQFKWNGKYIYLGRVPKGEQIKNRNSYEFYSGLDSSGNPTWTKDVNQKKSIFHDENGLIWHVGVSYNPGLNRYFLLKAHYTEYDDHDHTSVYDVNDPSVLGIFDSPTPWGPWTTVHYDYENDFIDSRFKFTYMLPPKYISSDGKEMWLAFSGYKYYDSVTFVKFIVTTL